MKYTKLERNWVMYDVGNSALVLLNTSVVPIYFNAINTGASSADLVVAWGNAQTIASLVIAMLMPILGALADYAGNKIKFFLGFFLTGLVLCLAQAIPAGSPSGIPQKITVSDGYSKSTLANGMYYVFPSGTPWIAAYDNKGILRDLIPTESFHGHRITASDDCILYQISEDKVAKVSALGRVTGVVQMKGYGKIRDFSYDGYDEVYWLGKKKKNEYLLATSFQTGNTRVVYRFKKDIQTGSLTVPQSGSIGVVAKNPSGVIYLDAITAAKPKISFVVGKKAAWKKVTAKKKINDNKKFTGWNTKESMLLSQENETIPAMLVQEENQYLAVEWQADVAKKTVQKKASATAVEAKSGSLLQKCGNNYVIVCGRAGTYLEMGTDGKAIRRYNYGSGLDSVQKLTLSGMYFYGI